MTNEKQMRELFEVIIDTIGGNCPVQAEGFIGDEPFYFRARGGSWSLSVGGDDPILSPWWHHEEDYGSGFDAGWMPEEAARSFISIGAKLYTALRTQTEREKQLVDALRKEHEARVELQKHSYEPYEYENARAGLCEVCEAVIEVETFECGICRDTRQALSAYDAGGK